MKKKIDAQTNFHPAVSENTSAIQIVRIYILMKLVQCFLFFEQILLWKNWMDSKKIWNSNYRIFKNHVYLFSLWIFWLVQHLIFSILRHMAEQTIYFPNCKYGINLFIALFDTSTGKILRARMLDLPCLFSKKYALPLYCRHCSHSIKRNILKLLSSLLFFIRKKKLQCKANYHHAAQSIIVHHRLSLYKNNELFSHHTFQNNQKNAESLFCVS